jgi:hypothetical protein
MLFDFWQNYREEDRKRIAACVSQYGSERIYTSDPLVNAIRYVKENEQILHLVNYNYDAGQDRVSPVGDLSVHVPWEGPKAPGLRWLSLDGEQQIACRLEAGELVIEIPRLDLYGLAILNLTPGST